MQSKLERLKDAFDQKKLEEINKRVMPAMASYESIRQI